MAILKNYQDLFLNQKKFTKTILKDKMEWWHYYIAVLIFTIIISALQELEAGFEGATFGFVLILILVLQIVAIFIINIPFKKGKPFSTIYKVNLAIAAYALPIGIISFGI